MQQEVDYQAYNSTSFELAGVEFRDTGWDGVASNMENKTTAFVSFTAIQEFGDPLPFMVRMFSFDRGADSNEAVRVACDKLTKRLESYIEKLSKIKETHSSGC